MNTKGEVRGRGEKGFVGIIILIIIALVLLKYFFNWSIFEAAGTPEGKSTLSYLTDLLHWLRDLAVSAWNYIH